MKPRATQRPSRATSSSAARRETARVRREATSNLGLESRRRRAGGGAAARPASFQPRPTRSARLGSPGPPAVLSGAQPRLRRLAQPPRSGTSGRIGDRAASASAERSRPAGQILQARSARKVSAVVRRKPFAPPPGRGGGRGLQPEPVVQQVGDRDDDDAAGGLRTERDGQPAARRPPSGGPSGKALRNRPRDPRGERQRAVRRAGNIGSSLGGLRCAAAKIRRTPEPAHTRPPRRLGGLVTEPAGAETRGPRPPDTPAATPGAGEGSGDRARGPVHPGRRGPRVWAGAEVVQREGPEVEEHTLLQGGGGRASALADVDEGTCRPEDPAAARAGRSSGGRPGAVGPQRARGPGTRCRGGRKTPSAAGARRASALREGIGEGQHPAPLGDRTLTGSIP